MLGPNGANEGMNQPDLCSLGALDRFDSCISLCICVLSGIQSRLMGIVLQRWVMLPQPSLDMYRIDIFWHIRSCRFIVFRTSLPLVMPILSNTTLVLHPNRSSNRSTCILVYHFLFDRWRDFWEYDEGLMSFWLISSLFSFHSRNSLLRRWNFNTLRVSRLVIYLLNLYKYTATPGLTKNFRV